MNTWNVGKSLITLLNVWNEFWNMSNVGWTWKHGNIIYFYTGYISKFVSNIFQRIEWHREGFEWWRNCRIKNAGVWPFRTIKSSFATAGSKVPWISRSIYKALNRTDAFEVSVCAHHRTVCFERTSNTGIYLDLFYWYNLCFVTYSIPSGR